MRVNLAYYTDTRIDFASGNDPLRMQLAELCEATYLDPCLPRAMPDWLTRKLAPPIGSHRAMSFWEPSALPLEYAVIRKLVTARNELVHVLRGDTHFNYAAWLRLWPYRGTLVVSFNQPPKRFEEVWRFRHKRARLSAIDRIIVQSTPGLHYFQELVGDRVSVVRHWVNRDIFNPPAERPVRDVVRCLSVGSWLRDPDLLRDTIKRVIDKTDVVEFTVLAPAAYLAAVEGLPVTCGGGVHGDDLVAAYQEADIFFHPAHMLAGSTAVNEAMACGLPMVVSDVPGARDYVDDECAELAPPGDADAHADAIVRLANDPDRRQRMGAHAEQRSREFDIPAIARELLAVYEKAHSRRA